LNDLERRNGVILRYFSEFGSFRGALRKSSRSLSHLLMSSCLFRFWDSHTVFGSVISMHHAREATIQYRPKLEDLGFHTKVKFQ